MKHLNTNTRVGGVVLTRMLDLITTLILQELRSLRNVSIFEFIHYFKFLFH